MLSVKRLNRLILLVLVLIFPQITMSHNYVMKYKGQCGGLSIWIKIVHDFDKAESQFTCYYKTKEQTSKIFYKPTVDSFLHLACVQNIKRQDVVLITEDYGGNSGPEDIYGIFDPRTKKMLIIPSDWPNGNSKQVQPILGFSPLHVDIEKNFFCCNGWASEYLEHMDQNGKYIEKKPT